MPKNERSKWRDKIFVWSLWLMMLGGLAGTLSSLAGCSPPSEGTDIQWPAVSFDSAQVDGYMVVETPAGESHVDLSTGVVEGDAGDVKVKSWGVRVKTAVQVNGEPQSLIVNSDNTLDDVGWRHCLDGELGVMGMLAKGRWPLSPECGPPGLQEVVYRPF